MQKDGKWGYIDLKGNVQIAFQFDQAASFSCGRAPVYLQNGEKLEECFIGPDGKKVFSLSLKEGDWYGDFCEDRLLVYMDGRFGYMDRQGKLVIPCIYEKAANYVNGIVCVGKDDRYGYIDSAGKEVIPLQYEWIHSLRNDRIVAYKRHDWNDLKGVVFDVKGKELFAFRGELQSYSNGIAALENGAWEPIADGSRIYGPKSTYLDKDGDAIMPFIPGYVDTFSQGRGIVSRKSDRHSEQIEVVDEKGQRVFALEEVLQKLPKQYDEWGLETYQPGGYAFLRLYISKERKAKEPSRSEQEVAVLDKQGEILLGPVPLAYSGYCTPLIFYQEGKIMLVECRPEDASQTATFPAQKQLVYQFITQHGVQHTYTVSVENGVDFHHSLWAVYQDGKWGYLNPKGEWAIEPQFDWADAFLNTRDGMLQ